MPQANLVTCSSCQSILDVLCSIDSKISKYALNHYKNDKYEINLYHPKQVILKLIEYRRILEKKLFNPSYTDYATSVLISRIKVLLNV